MHIWLLTHSEELKKPNGTGQIVRAQLPQACTVVVWKRTEPDKQLASLPLDKTLLIYPTAEPEHFDSLSEPLTVSQAEHVILLDGTWQQARKIYNRTEYLKRFQHYSIPNQQSSFQRRRNQLDGGLCTAETAAYLLHEKGLTKQAESLNTAFLAFNNLQS